MENSHQSTDGKMRDFCDGEYYQQHPLYSVDKTALQIFLYYDDFEVCNPLGSRVKKQKLGIFMFLWNALETYEKKDCACILNVHVGRKERRRGKRE